MRVEWRVSMGWQPIVLPWPLTTSHWEELGTRVLSNVSSGDAIGRNCNLVKAIGKTLEHEFIPMSALGMTLEEGGTLCEPLGRTWSTNSFQCQHWACHWKKLGPCASHWEELGAQVLSNVSTGHANERNWDLV